MATDDGMDVDDVQEVPGETMDADDQDMHGGGSDVAMGDTFDGALKDDGAGGGDDGESKSRDAEGRKRWQPRDDEQQAGRTGRTGGGPQVNPKRAKVAGDGKDSTRVEANDTDRIGTSVAASREGPRGAAGTDVTAAAVPTAAAVVGTAEMARLQTEEHAHGADAQWGEAIGLPASGDAAPLENSEDVTSQRLGREDVRSSQVEPQTVRGGSPRSGREVQSPHTMPTKLGAGPSKQGREEEPRDGKPPKKANVRRRVGGSEPAAIAVAARFCGAAAADGRRERPQGGRARRVHGAQEPECRTAKRRRMKAATDGGDDQVEDEREVERGTAPCPGDALMPCPRAMP